MEKELTTLEVRGVAVDIISNWDTYKKDIHLSPRSLYNMIGVKKALETEYQKISDALVTYFTTNNCPMNEDGSGFNIPPEKMDSANQFLNEFSLEKVKITYEPIKMTDKDSIPPELIEFFFDFITFE